MADQYRRTRKTIEHHALLHVGTDPFIVGQKYKRHDGKTVTCIQVKNEHKGYECAQFDDRTDLDNGYRYNRDNDRGRCTGTAWNDSKHHVIPIMRSSAAWAYFGKR